MEFRNILVFVDDTAGCKARLRLAVELARTSDAHLIGTHVVPLKPIPPYLETRVSSHVAKLMTSEAEGVRAAARRAFEHATENQGISAEWRIAKGEAGQHAAMHARYADLAIVGQIDPERESILDPVPPEEVVLGAGRPVLVIPYSWPGVTVGERVLVAWNASREAARAVNDALPFLQRAKEVKIIVINPRRGVTGHGEEPGTDIAAHLARHGIRPDVDQTLSDELTVADTLLSRAADFGTDLVVMGAYGHSRAMETVLGGATRDMLRHMTVPVLMSH